MTGEIQQCQDQVGWTLAVLSVEVFITSSEAQDHEDLCFQPK